MDYASCGSGVILYCLKWRELTGTARTHMKDEQTNKKGKSAEGKFGTVGADASAFVSGFHPLQAV